MLGPIAKAYAPVVWGIDLYKVYIFFVIVLALSFTTYAIAKVYGARGLVYSAILGGLVNSEATISSITSLLRAVGDPAERRRILRSSTILVIASMEARAAILLVAAAYIFLGPNAASLAALYSFIAVSPALVLAVAAYKQAEHATTAMGAVETVSPLNWGVALRSAVTYLALAAAARLAASLGRGATVVVGIIGGVANAGAAILGLASAGGIAGAHVVIAASLGAIGAAALNKPLYADLSSLTRSEALSLVAWSVILAVAPLGFSALILGIH